MKSIFTAIVGASLLVSTAAFAQNKKASTYTPPPYGMAGCGLGSLLFGEKKDNKQAQQIVAAILNNYFFPQSSAITSGTSNCTDKPADAEEAFRRERETYVSMNLGDLSKEASKGDGNYLRGLAEMIGCGSEEQFEVFAAVSQKDHNEIFSDTVAENVTNRFIAKAKQTETLQNCVQSN